MGVMACSTFDCSSRTASAWNEIGGSIAGQREQLQNVIWDHVPQTARLIVITAAPLYSQRLAHRDLHVIDITPVPDRLEDPVREAEHQNVLNRLFAEVVIDAVDLALLENLTDFLIQRPCGLEVRPERLLDDDSSPAMVFVGKALFSQLRDNSGKELWQRGQIIKHIARRLMTVRQFADPVFEPHIIGRICEVARQVIRTVHDPFAYGAVVRRSGVLLDVLTDQLAELVFGEIVFGEPENRKLLRQQFMPRQIVKRGKKFSCR